MSEAYDRFVKAYNSHGKERVDGVYLTDFVSMSPQEHTAAEDMLIKDAMQFDTTAILGLGELKSQKAEDTLRSLLQKVNFPSDIHLHVVEALWNITHDVTFQKAILDDFDKDNDALRRHAAIVMKYTTPSQITYDTFTKMLITEKDGTNRTTAAVGILVYFGLMKSAGDNAGFTKHLHLIRLLDDVSDDKSLAGALAEVEKEAVSSGNANKQNEQDIR